MTVMEIKNTIGKGEGYQIEFKSSKDFLSKDVFDTVCAFSNREGGTILLGIDNSGKIIPYLEIGGFSHRWPPLDVLRYEQPEVLNFGDCERLSSFCHHFSDRLKQFSTLNPVVLPCEGEE